MTTAKRSSLPTSRQPWDRANGVRVGTVVGGLVGVAVVTISGLSSFWIVAACGAIGGGVGYWSESRKQRPTRKARHLVRSSSADHHRH